VAIVDRVRAAVLRHCRTAADSRTLRARVVEELRAIFAFEWYVWLVTDPLTAVGVDPLAVAPDLSALPRIIKLKYTTRLNRWTGLRAATNLGSRAPDSVLWREAQRPAGVVDVASVAFRDRFGCWGWLDLWLTRTADPSALALLNDLVPPLSAALRLRQARTLQHESLAAASPVSGPAILILDDDLAITGRTAAADHLLGRLLPRPGGLPAVPAAALNVAAQLLSVEAGVDDGAPAGRVHVDRGQWVSLRASRIRPGATIAVSIELLSADERIDLCVRAFGLTGREAEVVVQIAKGADTDQLAQRLQITGHTVQDHLKSIFSKTGVHSRRDLVPLLLGSRQ
jgi:DNA-binding CsgD family transcriptional regulator